MNWSDEELSRPEFIKSAGISMFGFSQCFPEFLGDSDIVHI